ncbi:hypothetical protein NL676_031508 [Syzygium grande]|nr:hypothetical protein NL676_031508 [Syzygium grande]
MVLITAKTVSVPFRILRTEEPIKELVLEGEIPRAHALHPSNLLYKNTVLNYELGPSRTLEKKIQQNRQSCSKRGLFGCAALLGTERSCHYSFSSECYSGSSGFQLLLCDFLLLSWFCAQETDLSSIKGDGRGGLGRILLLLLSFLPIALGAFVGINVGTLVSNLPEASDIVAVLKSHEITHVRLYDADAHMLKALANSGIDVMVGVTNEEVLGIGESPAAAAAWINKNVAAYLPATNITAIAVGSEVLTSIPHAAPVLVPAMNNLHKALVASNLNFMIKVSTPQSMDVIPRPFPPSTAAFNSSWNSTVYQLLQFLENTNSSYMLNAYPYYGYTQGNGIFPLDYALFQPLPSVKQIVDPNTLFHYKSMFDAMVDATYYSIEAMNFSGIPVLVTETGWPWFGGSNEPDATAENAQTFGNNLIKRVLNGSGPPSQPNVPINTYIYELFNEDKRPGPVSEKNWGVFFTNGTSVYPLSLGTSSRVTGNSSGVFCIAKRDADSNKLLDGLNWACGQGQANCTAIQVGQPCYSPNTVANHASYAYNDYYQKMQSVGGTCDFQGTAMTTTVDPSYGSCKFAGSSNLSSNATTPVCACTFRSYRRRFTNFSCASLRTKVLDLGDLRCSNVALTKVHGPYSARAVDSELPVDLGCDVIGGRFLSLVRVLVHSSLFIFLYALRDPSSVEFLLVHFMSL